MMTARTLGGLAVAGVAGWAIGAEGGEVLRKTVDYDHHPPRRSGSPWQKLRALVDHMITDFTFMGRFVVLGGALAAALQTLVPQSSIAGVAHSPLVGSLALMGLAYLLSLCSEADAFVAVSFTAFTPTAQLAFLLFGPLLDAKLTFLYGASFRDRFVPRVALLAVPVILAISLWTGRVLT